MTPEVGTGSEQPGAWTFSTGFGVLMVAAAAVPVHGTVAMVSVFAFAAVGAGLLFRLAATVSVLLTLVALALSDPPPEVAALSGLSATAYLLLRHAVGSGVVTMTRPTVFAMLGFTLAGVAATKVDVDVPWLPLLAPPAVIAIYVLALGTYTKINGHTGTTNPTRAASTTGVGSVP